MSKRGFAMRYQAIIAEALEASELWVGTQIADIIENEKEALVRGVENGEAEEVTEELLPQLEETLQNANTQYQE